MFIFENRYDRKENVKSNKNCSKPHKADVSTINIVV